MRIQASNINGAIVSSRWEEMNGDNKIFRDGDVPYVLRTTAICEHKVEIVRKTG